MFLYAGKALGALGNPISLTILVLLFTAFALRKSNRHLVFFMVVFATAMLLILSSGWCSGLLLRALEQPYANSTIATAPAADAIVVLGGYVRFESSTGRPIEITGAADRLFCASELYHAAKAPLILLSGGNVFKSSTVPPEAELARRILEEWGIPPSAILTEDQSRSTHENAVFSQRILAARGIRRILLVTSAFHMRRAAATFRRTGLTIIPFASDFLAEAEPPDFLLSLLPDAEAIVNSQIAIKEWVGLTVYRSRGWAE
jgi:uncharacterized SAM-binding protein YcdF (DUF218 family)